MDVIAQELAEIGGIIDSARLLDTIKHEVRMALDGERSVVTGGEMADVPQYDVVVRHRAGLKASEEIVKRLQNVIANVEVSHIERLAGDMVGVKRKEKS